MAEARRFLYLRPGDIVSIKTTLDGDSKIVEGTVTEVLPATGLNTKGRVVISKDDGKGINILKIFTPSAEDTTREGAWVNVSPPQGSKVTEYYSADEPSR